MGDFTLIPLGNGKYLKVYAVPSGWQYKTGSSRAIMFNAGPFGGGYVDGTLVFHVTEGTAKRADEYRLKFRGWGLSVGKGVTPPRISEQKSSETMSSWAIGQVYRLPRSGAPMGQAQEKGSPSGFKGQFLLVSADVGVCAGVSTCFMFLGGSNAAARSLNNAELMQYKYALMFGGEWMGSTAGVSGSIFTGTVY